MVWSRSKKATGSLFFLPANFTLGVSLAVATNAPVAAAPAATDRVALMARDRTGVRLLAPPLAACPYALGDAPAEADEPKRWYTTGSGLRVYGLVGGLMIQGLGFRVCGVGFMLCGTAFTV
jgi:hypothetical protein